MNTRGAVGPAVIRTMVRRIVAQYRPEKVILFGSRARGSASRDADVDLLVVLPLRGSRRAVRIDIGVALADLFVPVDILVCTPEEFEARRTLPGTVERPAALEGKVLYARAG